MIPSPKEFKSIVFFAVLFFSLCLNAASGYSSEARKIAVLPLEINSAEDLAFLQKGIFSMFSSRLSDPGKVEVIEKEKIDSVLSQSQDPGLAKGSVTLEKAGAIGKALGADQVLFGSITMFGTSASIDISVADVAEGRILNTFPGQAKEPGEVITQLDKIADAINLKLFSRYPEQLVEPVQPSVSREPSFADRAPGLLGEFQTVYTTNGVINGIAVNDFNHDGRNELAAVFDHEIQILEYGPDSKLKLVKKIVQENYIDIIAVDSADINQNGYPEIFVTSVQAASNDVESFVIEFNGNDYVRLKTVLPWYLKVVRLKDGRFVLYGQENAQTGPYTEASSQVFQIEFLNGSWAAGQRLQTPAGFSVLSMAVYESGNENRKEILFTGEDGRLNLFDETGKVSWSSDYGFGGSRLHYQLSKADIRSLDAEGKIFNERAYFQPENLILDLSPPDDPRLVVIRNQNTAGGLFQNMKKFKYGTLQILNMNDVGLAEPVYEKKLPGQITCMRAGDLDNNKRIELISAYVRKRDNFSAEKSKTVIVSSEFIK